MSPISPTAVSVTVDDDAALERTTLRVVSLRLLPFLFVLYILNYLDRSNVAIAALQMNRDLGFNAAAYGLGAGIFFAGYALFLVPSTLMLAGLGARRWIAGIMLTWGLIASAMMFVRTPAQFYTLRFLLGVAEGGFYPGAVYYLSHWFPAEQRGRAISSFMIAIPLSSVVGGPLGGWLLGFDGRFGWYGWQWVFVVEGIPCILLSAVVVNFLTERIEDAQWLKIEERAWLTSRIEQERDAPGPAHHVSALSVLTNPIMWLIGGIFFLFNTVAYSYVFWAPTIIKEALQTSDAGTGLVVGGIACTTALALLAVGASSDRTGDRSLHTAGCGIAGAVGLLGAALVHSPSIEVASLALVAAGFLAYYPVLMCLTTVLLRRNAAAAGISFVNALSSTGGIIGPWFVGWLKDATGGIAASFVTLAALGIVGSALCVVLWRQTESRRHVPPEGF